MKRLNYYLIFLIFITSFSGFSQPQKSPDLKKPSNQKSFEGIIDFVWEKYQDTTNIRI